MKLLSLAGACGLLLIALLCSGCDEDLATGAPALLCDPQLEGADPADDTGDAASTAGGTLTLRGRNIWPYFSGLVQACDTTPTPFPSPAEPTGREPADYTQVYNLSVLFGGIQGEVLEAYELEVPTFYEALNGGYHLSDCNTCRTCTVGCNDRGCGGCEEACLGCLQVLEVAVPPLAPPFGKETDDGGLEVPIVVLGGINQSDPLFYEFVPACEDGADNDEDALTDEADPECALSDGWSEAAQCADGIDNDDDGLLDDEDPDCELGYEGTPPETDDEVTPTPVP